MSASTPTTRKTSPSTVFVTPPPFQGIPKVKRTSGIPDLTPSTANSDGNDPLHTSFDSETETVIPYDKGATDLYLAVESSQWEKALQIARDNPNMVKVWVASTGSENTVFSWNFWRRLPIHEACRKQPPPLLISELLNIYPESASLTTHFGELPLHQAVGHGACPAVVDLLLAANFRGCAVADNGGRTPLEILDDSQLREDGQIIKDSLERCVNVLDMEREAVERRIQTIRDEFGARMDDMRREHDRQLATRDGIVLDLNRKIDRGNEKAADLSVQVDERDAKIADKTEVERTLMEQMRKLEDDVSELMGKNRNLRNRISELDDVAVKNEATINKLNARVEELQGDLATELSAQEATIGEELVRAEEEMTLMVRSQKNLAAKIKKQRDAFKKKLETRGIDVPEQVARPLELSDPLLDDSSEEGGSDSGYSREAVAEVAAAAAARYLEQADLQSNLD